MANAIYPKYKEIAMSTGINLTSATIKATLVTTSYTYTSTHQFRSSISANEVGTAQTLGTKSVTNGTFDSANPTWTTVAGGSTIGAIVLYVDTGNVNTDNLIAYIDTASAGLPASTNGGDITFTVNASGWFTL